MSLCRIRTALAAVVGLGVGGGRVQWSSITPFFYLSHYSGTVSECTRTSVVDMHGCMLDHGHQ